MELNYSRSFKKDFKKLSQKLKIQFSERMEIFKKDYFSKILNNHCVHYPFEGCRSINITGDVRALYETVDNTAIFVRIGTHSELYN